MAPNPNPSRVTDAMWWLWEQLSQLEPSTQLGGIYADKPGYHNTRNNLVNEGQSGDYSIAEFPVDRQGPGDKSAAIDWTFPEAQHGDYSRITKYCQRLLASAHDPKDTRLDGWREFFGCANGQIVGWDYQHVSTSTTDDSSHLWHIHISETRANTESTDNKRNLLAVLTGQSTYQEDDMQLSDQLSNGKSVDDALVDIQEILLEGRTKGGPLTDSYVLRELSTIEEGVTNVQTGGVDVQALATALAPAIAPLVADQVRQKLSEALAQ